MKSVWYPIGVRVATIAMIATMLLSPSSTLASKRSSATSIFITEHPISSGALNITVEAPGKVWYTLPEANAIGSLVVSTDGQGNSASYPVPTANSEPYDLAYDNGNIWFTQRLGNKIGKFNIATEDFTEYSVPTANSEPTGIDIAPDGKVWFTERQGNKLGYYDPSQDAVIETSGSYPETDAELEDLVVQDNDHIWFTAPGAQQVGEYVVSQNQYNKVVTQFGRIPVHITIDQNNRPWITTRQSNLLGIYTPGTLVNWQWFNASGVTGIALSDQGNLINVWYTAEANAQLGRLTINGGNPSLPLVSSFVDTLTSTSSRPMGIAVDANGNVWAAVSGSNVIAQWRFVHSGYLSVVYQ